MEHFAKTVNGLKLLIIFPKISTYMFDRVLNTPLITMKRFIFSDVPGQLY